MKLALLFVIAVLTVELCCSFKISDVHLRLRRESGSDGSDATSDGETQTGVTADETPGETPADNAAGETPADDAAGETPADETPADDAAGETPAGDAAGETPTDAAAGETPAETPADETPAGDAAGETPADAAAGETPADETPADETPAGDAAGETPADDAAGETPADDAAGETPAETPADESPAGETPAETPADETPADDAAGETPAETPADDAAGETGESATANGEEDVESADESQDGPAVVTDDDTQSSPAENANETPAEPPADETPAAETQAGESPAGESPTENAEGEAESPDEPEESVATPDGETPPAETPAGETPAAETPTEEAVQSETPTDGAPTEAAPDEEVSGGEGATDNAEEQVEAAAAQGAGANGDGSGLEEDAAEPTSFSDNGVIVEKELNEEPEEDTASEEGDMQQDELDAEEHGETETEMDADDGDVEATGDGGDASNDSTDTEGGAATADATEEASQTDATVSEDQAASADGTDDASQTDTTGSETEAASADGTEDASQTDTTGSEAEAASADGTDDASQTDATSSETEAASADVTDDASQTDATSTETEAASADGTDDGSQTDATSSESETAPADATEEASTPDAATGEAKRRRKRVALRNPKRRWPKGIIPFSFGSGTAENIKKESLAAMKFVERHSCLRFETYNPATQAARLGHPGHAIFENRGYCASIIGMAWRKAGQSVTCSNRFVFLHEIGHLVFLVHEQQGDNRKGIVRINYDYIKDDKLKEYRSIPESMTLNSTGYATSAVTHYAPNINSKNGEHTLTVLNKAPGMQLSGIMYYTMAEINLGYKCKDIICPNKEIECLKDSYAVLKGDKCECQCTPGVDPATNCKGPKTERVSASWGPGKVSMPKPEKGCPDGFTDSTTIASEGNEAGGSSAVHHLAGSFGAAVSLPLCQSDGSGTGKWPMGRYCFMSADGECPSVTERPLSIPEVVDIQKVFSLAANKGDISSYNFLQLGRSAGTQGFWRNGTEANWESFEKGKVTLGQKDGSNLDIFFCCRDDGFPFEEVQMKNDKPFVLFRKHRKCQVVEDMYTYAEHFKLDSTKKIVKTGSIPTNAGGGGYKISFYYCYYVPLDYAGCGGVIDLTTTSPEGTLMTPNFGPGKNYTDSTMCTWIVSASEEKASILLNFEDKTFCLAEGDHVDVHHNKIGQPSLRTTGKGYKPTVVTMNNLMKIQFRSDLEKTCTGFKATVKMVTKEEQAYSVEDEGSSYRGTVNFTHNNIPCLPWTEMTDCPHHPFATTDGADGLDANYCRNPGNGLQPWCYIAKDNCERNYCDVSRIGRPADNYADCDTIISEDPTFCDDDSNAVRGCFKTCNVKVETPKTVKEISCGKPTDIEGGSLVDGKESYKLGEKATYKCSSGDGELEVVCTSTGKWTGGGYVCGDCPKGWTAFGDSCYLYHDDPLVFNAAKAACIGLGASIASVTSEEESDLLEVLGRETGQQWLGLYNNKWMDGSTSTFRKWDRDAGQPMKANIRKNAVILGTMKKMTWKTNKARSKRPMFAFTCKKKAGTRPCVDRLSNCADTLKLVPDACSRFAQNAWVVQQCRKTCGLCGDQTCQVPTDMTNAVLTSSEGTVKVGEVVTYECNDGFVVSTGALKLACTPSGLTDTAPACVEKSTTTRLSNDIDIRPRAGTFGKLYTYTGSEDMYRIDAAGTVIGWNFFNKYGGKVVFQIWRPVEGAEMEFVGQNEVTAEHYRPHTFNVPTADQIAVQAGDRIGIWVPSGGAGVPYDTHAASGNSGLKLTTAVSSKEEFVPSQSYEFVSYSPMKIGSFQAIVGPASGWERESERDGILIPINPHTPLDTRYFLILSHNVAYTAMESSAVPCFHETLCITPHRK